MIMKMVRNDKKQKPFLYDDIIRLRNRLRFPGQLEDSSEGIREGVIL